MNRRRLARPALADLLRRVYRHYPRGLQADDSQHARSEETRRLACVKEAAARRCGRGFPEIPVDERIPMDLDVEEAIAGLSAWRSFARRWEQELPSSILWDESNPWHDAGYRYSALQPGYQEGSQQRTDEVVCTLSILAPVYAIYTYVPQPGTFAKICYSSFPERYHERITALSLLVEDIFGAHRLGEEILLHPLPDVVPVASNLMLGQARLRDCLFSTAP